MAHYARLLEAQIRRWPEQYRNWHSVPRNSAPH
jgi:hypothetical protein